MTERLPAATTVAWTASRATKRASVRPGQLARPPPSGFSPSRLATTPRRFLYSVHAICFRDLHGQPLFGERKTMKAHFISSPCCHSPGTTPTTNPGTRAPPPRPRPVSIQPLVFPCKAPDLSCGAHSRPRFGRPWRSCWPRRPPRRGRKDNGGEGSGTSDPKQRPSATLHNTSLRPLCNGPLRNALQHHLDAGNASGSAAARRPQKNKGPTAYDHSCRSKSRLYAP